LAAKKKARVTIKKVNVALNGVRLKFRLPIRRERPARAWLGKRGDRGTCTKHVQGGHYQNRAEFEGI